MTEITLGQLRFKVNLKEKTEENNNKGTRKETGETRAYRNMAHTQETNRQKH